ncbi:hypothetical protein Tco_1338389 [Tanacetum coccineum]
MIGEISACRLLLVYDTIDKIIKNFLWTKGGNATGNVSVCWKDVCKPKSQGGLGLKPIYDWNEALMAKHLGNNLWDVELKKGQSWVWLQLLNLRDKIRRIILDDGLSLNAKVCDMIENRSWKWPANWLGRFSEVVNVYVPVINNDFCDRVVWIDKKGMEINFKGRLKTRDRLSRWFVVPDLECVLCRLVLVAAIYFLWIERNSRIYNQVNRSVDSLFDQVVSTVRLKLRGLVLKNSPDVLKASEIWNFLIDKSGYYNNMLKEFDLLKWDPTRVNAESDFMEYCVLCCLLLESPFSKIVDVALVHLLIESSSSSFCIKVCYYVWMLLKDSSLLLKGFREGWLHEDCPLPVFVANVDIFRDVS